MQFWRLVQTEIEDLGHDVLRVMAEQEQPRQGESYRI